MKLKKKLFIVISIIFILFNLYIYTHVLAGGVLIDDVVNFMGDTKLGVTKTNVVTNILSTIIAVVQVGVTGYFIISFTVVGIKYFTVSAVTPEAKAKCKNQLINNLIGGVIAFGATGIFRIIYELLNP